MPASTFAAPLESRYFEDYEPDTVHEFGSVVVEEAEVLEFAQRYDPQPFHTTGGGEAKPLRWFDCQRMADLCVNDARVGGSLLGSSLQPRISGD